MEKRTYRDFQEFLLENLQDPGEAAAYLQAAFTDEDERVFLLALRDVLEALHLMCVKN
jgi:DNA-binding phage protein